MPHRLTQIRFFRAVPRESRCSLITCRQLPRLVIPEPQHLIPQAIAASGHANRTNYIRSFSPKHAPNCQFLSFVSHTYRHFRPFIPLKMAPTKTDKYSVILPTYNERKNLPVITWLLNRTFTQQYVTVGALTGKCSPAATTFFNSITASLICDTRDVKLIANSILAVTSIGSLSLSTMLLRMVPKRSQSSLSKHLAPTRSNFGRAQGSLGSGLRTCMASSS